MRTCIATVCLSGGLEEKLHAAAAAGFDGVELFEADLVASPLSPAEVRALAERLGLALDLYQPFRDFEGVTEDLLADNLRRAEAKFSLMSELGIDTMLVCSNVGSATREDEQVAAAQLRELAERAAGHGVRIAYEALAWGRFVDDYRQSWRIVQAADHPSLGICLDSFHILSRRHDPAAIEEIPGERIFFVQLADAPELSMDILSWSRHHRLFPGEGDFDLVPFLRHVQRSGYQGPVSLEVFNDTFRQTDVGRTAVQALRSLLWLEDQASGPDHSPMPQVSPPTGFDFVEIKGEDLGSVELALHQLGFTDQGRHVTKPVSLWTCGEARLVLNEQRARGRAPHLSAIGLTVDDKDAAATRADQLLAPTVHRRTAVAESPLRAVRAPDGTEIFFGDAETASWVEEFGPPGRTGRGGPTGIDHVNLTQPWQSFHGAVLFLTGVLGLRTVSQAQVAGPDGLVTSQVMASPAGGVRLPLNVAPAADERPQLQHVALSTSDLIDTVAAARERGLEMLEVTANYYADLQARFDLPTAFVARLRELDVMYDRDADGEYLNAYTVAHGDVFIELVERRAGYAGFGAAGAPVRLAAQRGSA